MRFSDFPEFLSDIQGVFRIRRDPFPAETETGKSSGQVLHQLTTEPRDVVWGGGHGQLPMAVLGSKNWTDYSVTAVGRTNSSGANDTLAVYGRCGHGFAFGPAGGYALQVWPATGRWSLLTGPTHGVGLANGTAELSGWTQLELTLAGKTVSAAIDGKTVARVEDGTFADGLAGLGSGWHSSWFSSFAVRGGE